jgi:cyclic pyranopterin phosphate synthase
MNSAETNQEVQTMDTRGRALRDLRISLTDRCNLRCRYCMPKEIFGPDYEFLKKSEWLSFEELEVIVRVFLELGVRKIRLTGGEPLLRKGLVDFVGRLNAMGEIDDLALTTNGLRLADHAEALVEAGLPRVTVSLDGLDPSIVGAMNGMGLGPEKVLQGIDRARAAGLKVKVNMVVQRGVNDGEIIPMAAYFKERGVSLRFIEYMDVGNHNGWKMEEVVSGRDILNRLSQHFDLEPVDLSSGQQVAKTYRYADGSAEIGLITSVTQPFCGGCTRARISADGQLYTCLFASQGMDLKGMIRHPDSSDDLLRERLRARWQVRDDRYSEDRFLATEARKKVEMSYIGG